MKDSLRVLFDSSGVRLEETSTVRLKKEPSSPSKGRVKERYRVLKCDGEERKKKEEKGRKEGIGRKLSRRRFGERAPRACTPRLRVRAPGPFLKLMIRSLQWVAVTVESGGKQVVWARCVE